MFFMSFAHVFAIESLSGALFPHKSAVAKGERITDPLRFPLLTLWPRVFPMPPFVDRSDQLLTTQAWHRSFTQTVLRFFLKFTPTVCVSRVDLIMGGV